MHYIQQSQLPACPPPLSATGQNIWMKPALFASCGPVATACSLGSRDEPLEQWHELGWLGEEGGEEGGSQVRPFKNPPGEH